MAAFKGKRDAKLPTNYKRELFLALLDFATVFLVGQSCYQ
jgi:hypothetical protein